MNKDELISMLEEGLKIEESIIPSYAKHISSTLFLSDFPEEKRKEIKTALTALKNDSEDHKNIYITLLEKVKREDKDVY